MDAKFLQGMQFWPSELTWDPIKLSSAQMRYPEPLQATSRTFHPCRSSINFGYMLASLVVLYCPNMYLHLSMIVSTMLKELPHQTWKTKFYFYENSYMTSKVTGWKIFGWVSTHYLYSKLSWLSMSIWMEKNQNWPLSRFILGPLTEDIVKLRRRKMLLWR